MEAQQDVRMRYAALTAQRTDWNKEWQELVSHMPQPRRRYRTWLRTQFVHWRVRRQYRRIIRSVVTHRRDADGRATTPQDE